MSKIKFSLRAARSTTVRALNGKSYRLNPGKNNMELEYSDYVALYKALGLKPAPEKKAEIRPQEVKKEETKPELVKEPEPACVQEPVSVSNLVSEPESIAEPEPESELEPAHESEPELFTEPDSTPELENNLNDLVPADESVEDKEIDYSSMSYNQLKAEYKRITGESCKLKKADLIQFLQEH